MTMVPPVIPSPEEEDVVTHPSLYLISLAILAGIYLVLGLTLSFFGPTWIIAGSTANVGYLVWEIGLLHFLAGIRIVDANRIAGIFVLGWMTKEVSGTIICVPPGPFWVIQFDALTKEMEIPAEPENIWRGEGNPPADRRELRPPIRITFAEGENKDDPLERRVTEEVSFFVRIRVNQFFNFYRRIGSIEEAKHQLEDVGVSYLAEVLPQHTLSEAITKVKDYSAELDRRLKEATKGWGATVVTSRVKQFPFSRSLNTAIQKMAESTANKRAAIIQAQGEEEKRALEGLGTGRGARSELEQRAMGMKRMARELDSDSGRLILGAETARLIGQGGSTKLIVGAPGVREIIGLGAAIAESVQPTPPAPTPPTGTGGTS